MVHILRLEGSGIRRAAGSAVFTAVLGAWLCFTPLTLAQTLPGSNDPVLNPGILHPGDSRNQLDQSRPLQPEAVKEGAPEVRLDDEKDAASKEPSDEPETAAPHFVLHEILIAGVTVFSGKELEAEFMPWIDREVTYTDLLRIAADITRLYKSQGYITSRAVLPPQEIENGSVSIQVLEGRVGDIHLEGNRHVPDGYVEKRLHLKPGEVFRLQSLQRDMLDLSQDPLLDKAHATLKTSERSGASDISLNLADHFPLRLSVGVDNMGRKGIGLYRLNTTLVSDNVSGDGDSLLLNGTLADGTVGAFVQYRMPLNTRGWGLGGSYGYSHINAGSSPSAITIDNETRRRTVTGDSHHFSLFSDFPIYKSRLDRRWQVTGNVSLNFTDSMTYLEGHSLKQVEYQLKKANPANKVEHFPILRTLKAQVQAVEQDVDGRWLLGAGITQGVVALGGNDAYVKLNLSATRMQRLPWGMIGLLRAESQLTPNRLPFAEKMQLGGANSIRGYGEGYLISDGGYLFGAEVRYPIPLLPKVVRDDWQGLVFAEYGRVFECGSIDEGTPAGQEGSLLGYGVGVRGRLTRHLTARFDLGFAGLRRNRQPDLRAHFALTSQLF